MTHEDEVAFIMGEIAERARNPLPLARDLRQAILSDLASADANRDLGLPQPAGRLAKLRQVVVDVVRGPFQRQDQLNGLMLGTLRQLEALTTVLEERYKRGWANIDQRMGPMQRALDHVRERVAREEAIAGVVTSMQLSIADLHREIAGLQRAVEVLESDRESTAAALARARTRVDAFLDSVGRRSLAASPDEVREAAGEATTGAFDELYAAFEDEFRGSRAVVQDLQRPYLDVVDSADRTDLPVLDVGPGRGEWLELLGKTGADAYGIDLSHEMVAIGGTLGLDIRQGDALIHLAELDEGSLRGVTGFHFIEHIELDDQLSFLRLAARALAPGGVLVLETPNPTNLVVGASSFYLDPTHLRPVHPQLLEFLVRAQGLEEVEVRYVHPAEVEPAVRGDDRPDELEAMVRWALFGPQDYAVIARKGAETAA